MSISISPTTPSPIDGAPGPATLHSPTSGAEGSHHHHHHHGVAEGAQAGNSPFEQQLEAMQQAATNQTTTAADGTTNLVPAPGA
jgi:hypothetical protein